MDGLLDILVDNLPIVLVLGYWLLSERNEKAEITRYYRDEMNSRIDALDRKIDNLIDKLL